MRESAHANFVGAHLYAWAQCFERRRQSVTAHLPEIFAAAREAGYDFVEGYLDSLDPTNNTRFATALKEAGLRPVSLSADAALHGDDSRDATEKLLAAAKICREAGFLAINLRPESVGREKTDEELRTQADALDMLGRELNRLEMVLGVHTLLAETTRGARELRSNLRRTDAAHVGLCFDAQWLSRGKLSPLELLREYHERIVSWRLSQTVADAWQATLVDGDIDYPRLASFVAEHPFRGAYTVELAAAAKNDSPAAGKQSDTAQDKGLAALVENHRRSREYVRKVFGV